MIVVVAKLHVKDGAGDTMRALARTLAGPSRAEDGNLSYSCYEDALQPGTWFYFEEWRDQDALDRHFASPHFAQAGAVLNDVLTAPPAVTVYEVAQSRELRLG
jgi:quinol monooxygenase YgiN